MKKYSYMICSAAILCALMLAGCGSSHEKELEQQVAQLQKQVQDLQTDAADNPESTGSGESAPASAQEESTDTLDALTEKIQKAVQTADAATASGSLNERISVFFEHKTGMCIRDSTKFDKFHLDAVVCCAQTNDLGGRTPCADG